MNEAGIGEVIEEDKPILGHLFFVAQQISLDFLFLIILFDNFLVFATDLSFLVLSCETIRAA
jgi:hypothetical protein